MAFPSCGHSGPLPVRSRLLPVVKGRKEELQGTERSKFEKLSNKPAAFVALWISITNIDLNHGFHTIIN